MILESMCTEQSIAYLDWRVSPAASVACRVSSQWPSCRPLGFSRLLREHINDFGKHVHRAEHCLPGLACEPCSICGSQSKEPVVLLQAAEVGWAAAGMPGILGILNVAQAPFDCLALGSQPARIILPHNGDITCKRLCRPPNLNVY